MISLKTKLSVGAPDPQPEQVSIGTVVIAAGTVVALGVAAFALGHNLGAKGSAELAHRLVENERFLKICKEGQSQIYRAFQQARKR